MCWIWKMFWSICFCYFNMLSSWGLGHSQIPPLLRGIRHKLSQKLGKCIQSYSEVCMAEICWLFLKMETQIEPLYWIMKAD